MSAYAAEMRRVKDLIEEIIDPEKMSAEEAEGFLDEVQEYLDVQKEYVAQDIAEGR